MKDKQIKKLTAQEAEQLIKSIGLFFGIVSKAILESQKLQVDYKINGEDISSIEKLHALGISERIKLAVQEERYEDAASLQKLLIAQNKK